MVHTREERTTAEETNITIFHSITNTTFSCPVPFLFVFILRH